MQTEDWVKVRADQLSPRPDNSYDLRITAELWETHFIDHVALMAVDHPAGTESSSTSVSRGHRPRSRCS